MPLFADMSDAVYQALIAGFVALMGNIIATLGGIVLLWMRLRAVKDDVRKIEIATNSMKDQLVAASAKAGEQKGAEDERARAEQRSLPPVLESPAPGIMNPHGEPK